MEFRKLKFIPDKSIPDYYVCEVDLGMFKKEYRVFFNPKDGDKWLVYEDYKDIHEVENLEQGMALAQRLFENACKKVIYAMQNEE